MSDKKILASLMVALNMASPLVAGAVGKPKSAPKVSRSRSPKSISEKSKIKVNKNLRVRRPNSISNAKIGAGLGAIGLGVVSYLGLDYWKKLWLFKENEKSQQQPPQSLQEEGEGQKRSETQKTAESDEEKARKQEEKKRKEDCFEKIRKGVREKGRDYDFSDIFGESHFFAFIDAIKAKQSRGLSNGGSISVEVFSSKEKGAIPCPWLTLENLHFSESDNTFSFKFYVKGVKHFEKFNFSKIPEAKDAGSEYFAKFLVLFCISCKCEFSLDLSDDGDVEFTRWFLHNMSCISLEEDDDD